MEATSLQPYPAYKPSGVEWLGEAPAHWDVRRLKHVATLIMGQSPPSDECNFEGIGRPFLQGCAEFGSINPTPEQYCPSSRKTSPAGAILLSVRAPVGRLNIADQEYGIGRGLCAIVPANHLLRASFAFYAIGSTSDGLALESTGSTFDAVTIGNVGNHRIPLPPLDEQAAIAKYLDRVDDRIQRYLAAKERTLELLTEYRQAVINHAVTRGLDSDVKLKPSGVEWLGDVPAHWETRRVKHVVSNVIDLTRQVNHGDIYLALEHVESWTGKFSAPNEAVFAGQVKRFRTGDVLFGKLRPYLAKVARPNQSGVCVGEFLTLRAGADYLSSEYLEMLLRSKSVIDTIDASTFGAKMPRADWRFIGNMRLPLPPLAEQAAIAEYLDEATGKMDAAIDVSRRQIELMREYRTRLIADVVTGKVDVRGASAGQ